MSIALSKELGRKGAERIPPRERKSLIAGMGAQPQP